MTKSLTISLELLRAHEACSAQVENFERVFGSAVMFASKDAAVTAARRYAFDFDLVWAAERFLNVAAWAKYEKACSGARAEYDEATAANAGACEVACEVAWSEYCKAREAAFASALWDQEAQEAN